MSYTILSFLQNLAFLTHTHADTLHMVDTIAGVYPLARVYSIPTVEPMPTVDPILMVDPKLFVGHTTILAIKQLPSTTIDRVFPLLSYSLCLPYVPERPVVRQCERRRREGHAQPDEENVGDGQVQDEQVGGVPHLLVERDHEDDEEVAEEADHHDHGEEDRDDDGDDALQLLEDLVVAGLEAARAGVVLHEDGRVVHRPSFNGHVLETDAILRWR